MFVFKSTRPILNRLYLGEMVSTLLGGAAVPLVTPQVHLFNAPITINQSTVIGDFTAIECTFSGYAPTSFTGGSNPQNMDTFYTGYNKQTSFHGQSPMTITENAFGYFVDDDTLTNWVMAELFPTPIPFQDAQDVLDMILLYPLLQNPILP